jgi:hypothetical protein
MSGSLYGQHARSLYVQQTRPVIPRQRSNSLPPGLALMNAEEAGIIFSAAERATARRRKLASMDIDMSITSYSDSPTDLRDNLPLPTITTKKQSPLRQITSIRASLDKPLPDTPPMDIPTRALRPLRANSVSNISATAPVPLPEPLLQTLPVSPLSPKRQVASHSLKSYADGLFQFTQTRLTSTIPQLTVQSPPASPNRANYHESSASREPASVIFPCPPSMRPLLQSKFSDWSITTGAASQSQSLAQTPIDLSDPALMSPDSFFGVEETPRRAEFDFNRRSGMSFASSETYEPPSTLPPPTPPSRTPGDDFKEEISYFTNFDKYLSRDSTMQNWPLVDNVSPPSNVVIDLSLLEVIKSPITPPPTLRQRANTAMKHSVRSAPLMPANVPPCAPSPATPLQIAEVAIRVPHWLIGAIG